jgi:PAS domain S-box-containing protein
MNTVDGRVPPPTYRVLLVEDSGSDAFLIERELLKAWGRVDMGRVQTRERLVEALVGDRWDVVLSDHEMPGFSAAGALDICREHAPEIPFLVVSGKLGEESAVAMLKAGACDYIVKDRLSMLVPAIEREIREASIRRDHREALREIRDQAALIDVSPSAIIVLGLDLRIQFWSRGAAAVYGYEAEAVAGEDYDELLAPAAKGGRLPPLDALLESGAWRGELRHLDINGKPVVVDSQWTLIDRSGRSCILVVDTDITEKRQLERQFLRAQRLESIGMLASGIAHDLHNIFLPITMVSGLLKGRLDDEEGRKYLDLLNASTAKGVDLTRQMLSFVRGEKGGREAPDSVDSEGMLREISKMILMSFPKRVAIFEDAPAGLWPVSGNVTQLHQVLLNLCINARDAMPDGGTLRMSGANVQLSAEEAARTSPGARGGRYVRFSVRDTGTGIPEEIRGKIFEPFFSTKEIASGTGLGLSTVRKIVDGHNGFVTVDSACGEGSEFAVYIPAADSMPADVAPARAATELPKGGVGTVLVVDDERAILLLIKGVLETNGYRVIVASNGAEALHLFGERRPEIVAIVLDYVMPVLDGPETVRAIRRISPEVPIIYISGSESVVYGEPPEGVQGILGKPFGVDTLLEVVGKAIGARQGV